MRTQALRQRADLPSGNAGARGHGKKRTTGNATGVVVDEHGAVACCWPYGSWERDGERRRRDQG